MSEFLTNLDKYGYAKINNVFNEHEKKNQKYRQKNGVSVEISLS